MYNGTLRDLFTVCMLARVPVQTRQVSSLCMPPLHTRTDTHVGVGTG